MNAKLIAICTIIVLIVYVDTSNGKRGRSGGSSGLYSSRSRGSSSSSNFKKTGHTGGSQPGKIGWNVPEKKPTATNAGPKPSAPVNEHAAKSSASNVQSGYNPSGGYPRQQANNPYQSSNPSPGQGYNPSPGHPYGAPPPYSPPGSYNPGVGGHAPYGAPPAYGAPPVHGAPPAYGAPSFGQPSYGHSYSPSMGQMPQQTVLLQQSKPGIGQLAKEAFVFAGVSAGVNAAVNRLIPGGIYGTRGTGGGGSASAVPSHTEITYNNYYNNGTAVVPAPNTEQAAAASAAQPAPAVPAAPAAAAPPAGQTETSQANAGTNSAPPSNSNSQDQSGQNNPNPLGFVTSNDDLKKLTESLYEKETNSALKYITINLQGQKKDDSTNDDAAEPLLTVKDEAYEIPTVKAVLALHDNYELDVKTKEVVTSEERREESELIDKILETEVMKSTMKFLANKGYIPDDEYEFKDSLKRIWFSQFKRIDGDASSSGFETVFLAEKFDSDIIGLHNWIYYAKQESAKNLNYLGYIKDLKLGDKGAVLKIRSSLNDIVQPVSTLFVGTSPELEFALYTMCFFTRPNNLCPVSLAGHEFSIIVSRINYFGKDILISGYPDI
ncbi:poly(U)-specific endoribonuclease homolog [Ceratina calcarata]|uniref:Poly(U)-specific endoribonuclease homolog n=1 Tax=Ceratina calcarata TaxID=156304 RepID=A0AAJ7NF52_9HYME|nr:poly(U)-specific endoribonuclease homolog [Ceratina calcarata]